MTTQPGDSTPGLQLHLVDSDDEPLEEGGGNARRPSTASLSRFRSCPQLSSADSREQDSPCSDDFGLGPELCVKAAHFMHGSPRLHQRLQHRDDTVARSHSPTPPSTPGSRRSHVSLKDVSNGGASPRGGAPDSSATPLSRAVERARREHARFGRASSTDNPPNQFPFDDQNLRSEDQSGIHCMPEFCEEAPEVSLDGRLTCTEDGASTPLGAERHYDDPDSMDKCARWLQTLKMTSSDRMKSRSQIQLPPI